MNGYRTKLLVTLVLWMLAVAGVWWTSQADARGLSSSGASSHSVATRPGAGLACGEPDAGQGVTPPTPNTKRLRSLDGGKVSSASMFDWVRWTGRIWATLNLRDAR